MNWERLWLSGKEENQSVGLLFKWLKCAGDFIFSGWKSAASQMWSFLLNFKENLLIFLSLSCVFAGRENHVWTGTVPQLLHQQLQILLHLIHRRCKCATSLTDQILLWLIRCDNHWMGLNTVKYSRYGLLALSLFLCVKQPQGFWKFLLY